MLRNLDDLRPGLTFSTLLSALQKARARIDIRIRRLSLGNPGDVKPVGEGVSELRIDYGPGYRVYDVQQGDTLVILLAGGTKQTQAQEIKTALDLARNL